MKKLLFLAFLPIFGLLLSNNCSALQYDYKGLTIGDIFTPSIIYDSDLSLYHYDWSQSSTNFISNSNSLNLIFPNNYDFADTSLYSNIGYYLSNNSNYIFNRNGHICYVDKHDLSVYDIVSNGRRFTTSGSNSKQVNLTTRGYPTDNWTSIDDCYKRSARDLGYSYSYFDSNLYNFRITYFNGSTSQQREFPSFSGMINNIGSTDGLRLSDSLITQSGITYNGSFSFSRVFQNNNMLGFSTLNIPLSSWDGYFLDYNNLYQGREFEWKFVFNFDGGVFINTGSSVFIQLRNATDLYSNTSSSLQFPCQTELINSQIDGEDFSTLEVSCPLTLPASYSGFFPYLQFVSSDGDDVSFFSSWTPKEWSFSSALLITDNNTSFGGSFNQDLHGNLWSLANGSDYTASLDPDWLTTLKNLFNFSLSNTPLGFIFGSFNNDNCANIPIIAGMIHSEESQVCPWFSAETRSITTPVFALFSGFLIFGFFMRWLGSSSGNFVEDSSTHESGNFTIKKRGK